LIAALSLGLWRRQPRGNPTENYVKFKARAASIATFTERGEPCYLRITFVSLKVDLTSGKREAITT
jgi:hypothetical protein